MGELSAGCSKVVITPPVGAYLAGHFRPRKSTGVHDDLYARALVLSDGDVELALVVCDLLCVDSEVVSKSREIVRRELGIPEGNVMVAATHTHTGPYAVRDFMGSERLSEEYLSVLPSLIAGAVIEAHEGMERVRVGFGVGREDGVAFNRRYYMRDGRVVTNPGRGNPDVVGPAGPVDPSVGVVRLDRASGGVRCLLVNYANHVDVVKGTLISADYPGIVCRFIERALGGRATCIYTNGAMGDVNHINVRDPEQRDGYEEAERIGVIVACEALRTALEVRCRYSDVELASAREVVRLPLRRVSEEEVERARRVLREGGASLRDRVYATEALLLHERYERGERYVEAELQVLSVGDCALAGVPGELFAELGLRLKEMSPFPLTLVVGLANGYVGYIPTARAYDEGGYEVRPCRHSKLARGSGELLVERLASLTRRLYAERAGRA